MPVSSTWTYQDLANPVTIITGNEIPPTNIPTDTELTAGFLANLDAALGGFVKKMVDNGYKTTILSYHGSASLHLVHKEKLLGQIWSWTYQATTVLQVNFETDKSIAESPVVFLVWLAIAIAIVLIGAGIGEGVKAFLQGLGGGSKTTTIRTVKPDGTIEEETRTETPSSPLGYIPIILVGLGGLILLPQIIDAFKGRKKRAAARRRS